MTDLPAHLCRVGKYKYSQNRNVTDPQRVVASLKQQGTEAAAQLAAWMQERIKP